MLINYSSIIMAPVPPKLILLLRALNSLPSTNLSEIVECLDVKSVNLLSQLIHNVVYNTMNIPRLNMLKIKRRMRKNSDDWRHIINPKGDTKKKRSILKRQSGAGVLGAIISIVAPILMGLFSK